MGSGDSTDGTFSDDLEQRQRAEPGTESAHDSSAAVGDRIGCYRLLQVLGEGGMGQVFEAQQEEPVRRRVALKIVKWGMDTRRVIARFETERQALAMMNHPNIARVLDAGATEQGRPYFVMERVKGVPITQHCDTHRLDTRARIELFIQVCDGVQHAHHKGVIHRDIKPSNVLVTIQGEQAIPKIIDFGVAKATAQQLTSQEHFTELGQVIGTPEYMSPEQAEMTGQDIDTRTDVYSLGALLYELLVGVLPFGRAELDRIGLDEFRRKIRETDPLRPSTRITISEDSEELARRRGTDPTVLSRDLRGDLDWITMRALEKDRTRRYGSPSEAAADLRRFLTSEPILARPPSTAYRAAKFVQRNRIAVAMASIIFIATTIGLAGIGVGYLKARQDERRARIEATRATEISNFLSTMLGSVSPDKARGHEVTVREVLDDAATRIDGAFAKELAAAGPSERAALLEVEAGIRETIGTTYLALGRYDEAESQLSGAVQIYEDVLDPEDERTLLAENQLARVILEQGRHHEAEARWRRLLEVHRRRHGEEAPATLVVLQNLGSAFFYLDKFDEARRMFTDLLEVRRRVLGAEDFQVTRTMTNLAHCHQELNQPTEAEQLFREVVAIRRRTRPAGDPATFVSVFNLGEFYNNVGRYEEADPLLVEALAGFRGVYGEDHEYTVMASSSLANVLSRLGRIEAARPSD